MYELMQAGLCSYYMDCPSKVGFIVRGDEVCLVDTGGDKDAGKKALRLAQGRGWRVKLVLNTHSHADHIGGNRLVQQRTGAPVYAPGIEADFVRWPVLEPATAWGGCPPRALRGKFWMAQPSDALPAEGAALPQGIDLLRLDGHAPAHMAVKAPDGVWFVGDAVIGEATLQKYHISFLYDIGAFLHSLEVLEALPGTAFVPAHAPAVQDIRPLVQANRAACEEVAARILEICRAPHTDGGVLKALFDGYGLTLDMEQHAICGATVRSYFAYLEEKGLLAHEVCENRLVWRTREGCA
jgi:glyoxylase-like metal-dependent hydrolase (beta-lactamase superfamily II)